MAIFKCKMCGGALEINHNETVATCEYCGTKQTLPKLDDERKANLYDRANHFRRNNDFDKAMGIYEKILNEDGTDAEAYWSLVLCRYGIEYVEDPTSHKRIPTINRAQFTSIFDDDNYKSALQYADSNQRYLYEEEAKAINEIQKGILAISQKEEPFDVFICYKETDSNGRRTPDSVLGQELYYQLTQVGYKVFFSRITLEDQLGSAYEPYIFAALNSAKVMVVLGTKPEFLNAVWVKNEWSRYLALIKNGAKKMLIPAYKDMDPYDLPEEFSHLQAQDMSKLGFMQDLVRGIQKIVKTDEPKAAAVKETVVSSSNNNTAPLLERAFMFLEDGDWASADEYCEKVLDLEPKNAQAYLGKLMAELHVKNQGALKDQAEPFDYSNNYQKAIRFGEDTLKNTMAGYINHINTRNETARLEEIYNGAQGIMACLERTYEENSDYEELTSIYKEHISNYEEAIMLFESISGWKDAEEQISICQKKIEELKAKAEADRLERECQAEIARKDAEKRAKRNKKIAMIVTPIVCVVIAFIIVLNAVIIPSIKYTEAVALMDAGNIVEAFDEFIALDGYKDSKIKAASIYNKYKVEKLKLAKVGDYIFFGAYEQDNNTTNGKEYIEWLVLDIKDGKALVISKYALDYQQYHESWINVTWETCTLRQWLNNDFINKAFLDEEKAMIPTVTVSADRNPDYSTNPGNATQDKVFLLSITEANEYFSSDNARQCELTDYAVAKDDMGRASGICWWMLRSPGDDQDDVAGVGRDGIVHEAGLDILLSPYAVRPALWIDLNV